MVSIFLLMIGLWCIIGIYFTKHPSVAYTINKYGQIITLVVLILLGLYIMFESRSYELFT